MRFYEAFNNYRFEKEELVRIVKKFKRKFLDALYANDNDCCDTEISFELVDLVYLAENYALSIEDIAGLLDYLMTASRHLNKSTKILAYLLDKDYPIKPKWILRAIYDNELIERIKAKHAFTFREIYEAVDWYLSGYGRGREFYAQIQRHFPDSNFKLYYE